VTLTAAGPARQPPGQRPACLARLPGAPGVYRFADARGRVLYIGRASCLRDRVRSYWAGVGDRPHLRPMVRQIASVQAASCDSEHEAAWLERILLERQLPRWNRTAGSQEVAVWIALSTGREAGLKVVHARAPAAAGTRYFGPYLGGLRARQAVSGLHRVLPLALTAGRLTSSERDLASARGVGPADWGRLTARAAAVLERDQAAVTWLRGELTARRDRASARLAFELAARLQDEIRAVEWVTCEQKAALAEPADFDVTGWADGVLVSFGMRAGRLCTWRQRRCTTAGPSVAATPPAWREFGRRNAALAATLLRSAAGQQAALRRGEEGHCDDI
jgi:excinuclease ABC subunit C